MTTRKKLIERIRAMQLGTQEMLDAAEDDATPIPFDTLFATTDGEIVARETNELDDSPSVCMCGIGVNHFYLVRELRPMTED